MGDTSTEQPPTSTLKDISEKAADLESQPKVVILKEKIETKKCDKNKQSEVEEPKPRIVLTFRSEKPGLKSNMKIVSNEEKLDEVSTSRSTRQQGNESDAHEEEPNGYTSKNNNHSVDESDEAASDTSNTTLKRSVRCRNKEYSDNVLSNAIARKEKLYDKVAPFQRPSRRIKPTAKTVANKELRTGLETQNNARLGIINNTDKSPEEGVQTRRSTRRRSLDTSTNSEENAKMISPTESTPKKRKVQTVLHEEHKNEEEAVASSQESKRLNKMKKRHLSKLGLQARESPDDSTVESTNTDSVVELLDTQGKLTEEAEHESEPVEEDEEVEQLEEDDDEDFEEECSQWPVDNVEDEDFIYAPRRCTRSGHVETKNISQVETLDEQKDSAPRRRSTRLKRHLDMSSPYASEHSDDELAEDNEPPEGDEGADATCPDDTREVKGSCLCEAPSNMYAAPSELEEPVFCRAIETVDGIRVGCSHSARRDPSGSLSALLRAGPRAPFFLACKLHEALLRRHMCCPSCALFCTQGTFYQCSKGHFFHLECGVIPPTGFSAALCNKSHPGCPHCGVLLQSCLWWEPINRDCFKVKIEMKSSNKRILFTEQRVQCTPAYLGFSRLSPTQLDHEPVIPEDLLPTPPIDVKRLRDALRGAGGEGAASSPDALLRDAIIGGETAELLIPKLLGADIKKCRGDGNLAHLAARRGNLTALYLLQYAGVDLDQADDELRTPLMVAIIALLDKSTSPKKSPEKSMKPVPDKDAIEVDEKVRDNDNKIDGKDVDEEKSVSDENLMKVIRYLVAAGCDVNTPGPEGMTALHLAASLGGDQVCSVILGSAGAEVDPRDHGGWTPLVWAAENKHATVVRVLVCSGADVEAADGEGNAAMHWCALAGAAACLRLLLDVAPDRALDVLNAHHDTPLHVAARQGHYPCVVILLARGARTDIENSAGELAVEVCSGDSQNAISLKMQLAITVKDSSPKYKVLSSDMSCGRESLPVPCVNEVDDAPLPDDFTYVTRHVTPNNIFIDNSIDTMKGCSCKGGGCYSSSCSCSTLGVKQWFTRGRLAPSFPYHEPPMLFECNQTCACDMKQCCNTVVTRASQRGAMLVRAQVFRCHGDRGWGLRATAAVLRGTPVALYCGELLTVTEADSRPRDHYMFALDLKPDLIEQCTDKTQLCVDAAVYGSAARFINHSCRPNLAPVRVFTETRDLRLPTITLFATRDIKALEEFTFDYGDKFWSVKSKWMCCECGAADCRYPTKTVEDNASAN